LSEAGLQPVFKVWGDQNTFLAGKDFCICHMFNTNYSENNKILEAQKNLWITVHEFPSCLPVWAEPTPENLQFGGFLCVQGG